MRIATQLNHDPRPRLDLPGFQSKTGTNREIAIVLACVTVLHLIPFLACNCLATTPPLDHEYSLSSSTGLHAFGGTLEPSNYRGKRSVRLAHYDDSKPGALAVLPDVEFKNGAIDFDIAGLPVQGARPDVRGFVGIAFHSTSDHKKFECFYLRETNARSEDQERRNHTVQYCCVPEYDWQRLRQEKPFRYEAYTDLEPGAWTHVKVRVAEREASFYVGNSSQPCLVVHDLLLGATPGKVALWVGDQSCGYFANVKIRSS